LGRPRADASLAATPDRILEAAAEAFAASGYRAARLSEIAARAGIRRPSLLYHFRTKDELYAATVEQAFARLGRALHGSMASEGSFVDRLLATTVRYAEFLDAEPAVARIILREFIEGDGPGAALLIRKIVPVVDAVEAFVVREGGADLQEGLPVRAAIMACASDLLLRSAAGDLRAPLWGADDRVTDLTRRLFLGRA
jgi:AcrR family transcriptional regulator